MAEMETALLREQLQAYYHRADPDFQITDFTPISDGWETEVYSFTLTLRAQSEQMILRMYPGDEDGAKCEREYDGMAVLKNVSIYPVPSVFYHETDAKWLGKPFIIMQKIDGQPLGRVMREDGARQPELLTRFVQLFVDLHTIDYTPFLSWRAVPAEVENNPLDVLPGLLSRWRAKLSEAGQAWAVPVLDWLDTHRGEVPAPHISVMHNDFHPNNVLITPDDKLYVIDWSGFAIGDYRRDLAWTLLLISTSGYPQLRDLILSEYVRLSGKPVEHIDYFDVLAALRRLSDFAGSVGSGAEAMGMRPETVAIMRSQRAQYEQVYALLQSRTGLTLPEIEQLLATL